MSSAKIATILSRGDELNYSFGPFHKRYEYV